MRSIEQPREAARDRDDERQEHAPDRSDGSPEVPQSVTEPLCAPGSVAEDCRDALAAWICRQNIKLFERRLQECDARDVDTLRQLLAEEKIRLKALCLPR